jgi:two-component system invasion response regulator UvrY
MHDSQIMISRAIDAGASGYLTKSSAAAQMVDAVRTVAKGKSFLDHKAVPTIVKNLQNNDLDPLSTLTKREFEVFSRLAAGSTVTEIADQLSISPKTAGVHQTNIMNKLQLRNAVELTHLAIRCGISQP